MKTQNQFHEQYYTNISSNRLKRRQIQRGWLVVKVSQILARVRRYGPDDLNNLNQKAIPLDPGRSRDCPGRSQISPIRDLPNPGDDLFANGNANRAFYATHATNRHEYSHVHVIYAFYGSFAL